ncbi:hypothetical protein [Arthrobacter sp. zg-Y750]|uniref:hypothetical protein n=1 Tax=Arthrobacter sp. zg-Y750 TaxID=2894189 RepID=UPI001E45ECA4|nr:hypothetical protein [Arthrobacter sp. zg-Y750]MCC9178946.1 hypothetical protein [Arthrobacter sp. zg-Y750]
MWLSDGRELTGSYGTWKGKIFELRQTAPLADGTLILERAGGDSPGPEWVTQAGAHSFGRPPVAHIRFVPADEVKDIHAVSAEGIFGSRCRVFVLAEDGKGNLAVEASAANLVSDKKRLLSQYGFEVRPGDPVERTSVLGWLPVELVHDFKSEVVWPKDDDLRRIPCS